MTRDLITSEANQLHEWKLPDKHGKREGAVKRKKQWLKEREIEREEGEKAEP